MGSPKEVVDYYNNLILKKSHKGNQNELKIDRIIKEGWGTHSDLKASSVELIALKVLSEDGEEVNTVTSEENIILDLKFKTFTHYRVRTLGSW